MKKRPNEQFFLREATIGNKTFVPFVREPAFAGSPVVIFLQDNHPLNCGSSLDFRGGVFGYLQQGGIIDLIEMKSGGNYDRAL